MKKKILVIGSGGHASSLIDLIESTKQFKIIGIICDKRKKGDKFLRYKILGDDKYLKSLKRDKPYVSLGFSLYKNLSVYKKKYLAIEKMGFKIPKIISPFAYVSKSANLNDGVNIFHGVIINNNCKIGKGVTINSKTLIEHDCKIDSFSHISTGCVLNGNIRIKEKTFVGSGTIIKENIKIYKKKFIKIGSLIIKNL